MSQKNVTLSFDEDTYEKYKDFCSSEIGYKCMNTLILLYRFKTCIHTEMKGCVN